MPDPVIRLLETPEDMALVEELQRAVWPGSETDVVPAHIFITATHNGGFVLGAFMENQLIGFVFGFPGIEFTPDGPRPKHCSHMMGIRPAMVTLAGLVPWAVSGTMIFERGVPLLL